MRSHWISSSAAESVRDLSDPNHHPHIPLCVRTGRHASFHGLPATYWRLFMPKTSACRCSRMPAKVNLTCSSVSPLPFIRLFGFGGHSTAQRRTVPVHSQFTYCIHCRWDWSIEVKPSGHFSTMYSSRDALWRRPSFFSLFFHIYQRITIVSKSA